MNSTPVSCASSPKLPSAWPGALLLIVLYLLTMTWNLDLQEISNPDEPRYACPARDMALGKRDWMVPWFNGSERLVKPILLYWLLAIAGKIALWGNLDMALAFRLVPVLCGLGTVLFAYGLGRRLFGAPAGLMAGLILLSMYLFHYISRTILIDPLLTCCLAGAWYFLAVSLQGLSRGVSAKGALLGFYLSLGLGCLAKGPPLVTIFVVLPACAYLFWDRRSYVSCGTPKALCAFMYQRGGLLWGTALAVSIGLSWYLLLIAIGHLDAVHAFIFEQNIARAAGKVDHNTGTRQVPYVYYLKGQPGQIVPWTFLVFPALLWSMHRLFKKGANGAERLLHCALIVPFALLGLAASKRHIYLLPLYPILSLWLAAAWQRVLLNPEPECPTPTLRRIWVICLSTLALFCMLTIPVLIFFIHPRFLASQFELQLEGKIVTWAIMAVGVVAMPLAVVELFRHRYAQGSLKILLFAAMLMLAYEDFLRPSLELRHDKANFYAKLSEAVGKRHLVWVGGTSNEAVWYLDREIHDVPPWALKEPFFDIPEALVLIREKEWKRYGLLQDSVRELQRLPYGSQFYVLAEAQPGTPNPALFERDRYRLKPGVDRLQNLDVEEDH